MYMQVTVQVKVAYEGEVAVESDVEVGVAM